jgi:Flp pilus assembly protein TadD
MVISTKGIPLLGLKAFSRDMAHSLFSLTAGLLAISLGGCQATALMPPLSSMEDAGTTLTMASPNEVKYYASDEPLKLGQEYFNRGIYGTAERHFQKAVEKAPMDPNAWIGLAATYDRLARFDLADRAYRQAIKLTGETPKILNNEGYSYMLRGNLGMAREKLMQANSLEPENPTVLNNLTLLNESYSFIQRDP